MSEQEEEIPIEKPYFNRLGFEQMFMSYLKLIPELSDERRAEILMIALRNIDSYTFGL